MIPVLLAFSLIVAPAAIRVIDGDTVEIWACYEIGCHKQSIRLIGIDAPETSWNRGRYPPECEVAAGVAAQLILRGLLDGAQKIEFAWDKEDRWGRWLASATADDTLDIGTWLMDNGYARPYVPGQLGGWC